MIMEIDNSDLIEIVRRYSDKELCEYIVRAMLFRGHVMQEFRDELKRRKIKFESLNLNASFSFEKSGVIVPETISINLEKWIERRLK